MKMLLPVGKARAWDLIATAEGLASWLPSRCEGTVEEGEWLTFAWPDGSSDRLRLRRVGKKHSAIALDWTREAEFRVYLHGRLTTLTLEVEYRKNSEGRRHQLSELPRWAFWLANLKSVAVHGRDLRSRSTMPRRPWNAGFIDG